MKTKRLDISGVLLFDKSLGDSSNQALQRVKRLFRAAKTGHTGTLDPLASGLLPLMFGQATKFADDLIVASKTYRTTVKLGFSSSTGDAEGVIKTDSAFNPDLITKAGLKQAAVALTGEIEQVPPMYSALKRDGVALYELARKGVEVERQARRIFIYRLDVLDLAHQPDGCFVTLDVECSKGTYVRTLAEDFAKQLGTFGYLTALRRTGVGALCIESSYTLDQLESIAQADGSGNANVDFQIAKLTELLLPVDSLLTALGRLELNSDLAQRFCHGQRLPLPVDGRRAGRYRVYGPKPDGKEFAFLGTGNLETQGDTALLRPARLIQDSL